MTSQEAPYRFYIISTVKEATHRRTRLQTIKVSHRREYSATIRAVWWIRASFIHLAQCSPAGCVTLLSSTPTCFLRAPSQAARMQIEPRQPQLLVARGWLKIKDTSLCKTRVIQIREYRVTPREFAIAT